MIARPGIVGRALGGIVAAVIRRPLWVIAATVVLAGLCGRYAADHLGINTDTANMISPTLDWRQDFIAYREAFPARDRNIVVAMEASDSGAAVAAAAALAAMLEARPDHFESVFLAGHGEFFDRNGLLYLPLAELEALSDDLIAAQPFLGRLARAFSGAAVLDLAREGLEAEGEPIDVAGLETLLAELAQVLTASAAGDERPLRWRSLLGGEASNNDDARQLLLLRPVLDFSRMQPARDAIETIRAAADELTGTFGEPVRVRLTGTVAMEHEELVSVTRGAAAAGLLALVMVVAVLIWALRSVVLLFVAVFTLLVGLVFTGAFAAFAVGHLNLISVAFAVLYVGLGVDFILHVCLRLKELVAKGREPGPALVETGQGVGVSLVICAVTTAAGFYAFIPTEFDGVSELGLISGSGIFISLLVSVTLLPALLKLVWHVHARGVDTKTTHLQTPALRERGVRRTAVAIVATTVVLGALSLMALPRLEFDSNPIHLRDPASESIVLLNELAAASEAPLFSMAAIADDQQTGRRWAAALRDHPLVERVVTAADLVPAEQDAKVLLLEDLRFVLGEGFGRVDPVPFEAGALDSALTRLRAALAAAVPGTTTAGQLRRALDEWLARQPAAAGARTEQLRRLDGLLRSDLPEQLERLGLGLGAAGFDRDDLPPELRDRWIDAAGRELVEFVPAEDLNDNAAAGRFVAAVRAVVPRATGLPVVYQEASRTIVSAFSQALTYALIMVTILLLVLLRRVGDALLVLGPILFAAAATAGVAVALGLPFNFANIIALPLLIGVGVDSGIHIVHRMRSEPPRHGGAFETSTSRAVLASGLTTIASFGNLAFSEHLGMASMGQLLTIGMLVTLAATLVLLPALLELKPGQS